MHYFQCTCTVLTAGVGKAAAFDANEAIGRLCTVSDLRKYWLSTSERIYSILKRTLTTIRYHL